jgi:hypothetical protein
MNILLKDIKPNPANPRFIKDHSFASLKKSIAQFPQMLNIRGVAIKKEGKVNIALGGNQRYRALCDLSKEVAQIAHQIWLQWLSKITQKTS